MSTKNLNDIDPLVLDFITEKYTEVLSDLLFDCISVITEGGVGDDDDYLESVVKNEDIEDSEKPDLLYTVIESRLDKLLESYRISLVDSDLRFKQSLLDTLFTLRYLDEYETMVDILQAEESSVDKLATLVRIYGSYPEHTTLSKIYEVDDILITALLKFSKKRIVGEDVIAHKVDAGTIRLLYNVFSDRIPVGLAMLSNGVVPGLNVEQLLNLDEEWYNNIENLSINDLADDTFSLLVIANGGIKGWETLYENNKDLITQDPNKQQKMLDRMRIIISDLDRVKANSGIQDE